jgi:hypothetical protein
MTVCFKGRINFFVFLSFIVSFTSLYSCKKKEDNVGDDFIDERVGFDVRIEDTLTVTAYTTIDDSARTRSLSPYYLGGINDAIIGTVRASVVTHITLPILGSTWNASAANRIDSIVLQVKYFPIEPTYIGNKNTVQRFKLYQLDETLSNDSAYYSRRQFEFNAAKPLGEIQTNFASIKDSVSISLGGRTTTLAPHLRIRVTDANFINYFKSATPDNFSTTQKLQEYFRGFIIEPDDPATLGPNEGAIAYVDLKSTTQRSNTVTALVVYYNDSLSTEFPIYTSNDEKADNNIRLNQFSHQFNSNIDIQPKIGGMPASVNYASGLSGLKTHIQIPHLYNVIKDKKIALLSAEVFIKVVSGSGTSFAPLSPTLNLFNSDSLGKNTFFRDISGGFSFSPGTLSGETYKFNITQHLQYLLKQYSIKGRNENYGLNLLIPGDPYRVILDTSPENIKLKLTYTVTK